MRFLWGKRPPLWCDHDGNFRRRTLAEPAGPGNGWLPARGRSAFAVNARGTRSATIMSLAHSAPA